jgi:pyruvate/2-oxoglutarate dehydrogenase complex dihydrolipoamide acyltransferase (E2) component
MAAQEISVPDIGDFTDVPIIEIHVAPGDTVAVDDPLLTMESDKATLDVPSPVAGTVTSLAVAVGDTVSQGTVIGVFETAGAAAATAPKEHVWEAAHPESGNRPATAPRPVCTTAWRWRSRRSVTSPTCRSSRSTSRSVTRWRPRIP